MEPRSIVWDTYFTTWSASAQPLSRSAAQPLSLLAPQSLFLTNTPTSISVPLYVNQ